MLVLKDLLFLDFNRYYFLFFKQTKQILIRNSINSMIEVFIGDHYAFNTII